MESSLTYIMGSLTLRASAYQLKCAKDSVDGPAKNNKQDYDFMVPCRASMADYLPTFY